MATEDRAVIGRHVLLDLHGVAASLLCDPAFIQEACLTAAKRTFATVLSHEFRSFGPGQGVTGLIMLAESHLSIHTWPEIGFAAVDIFTCGSSDPEAAIPILKAAFKPKAACPQVILRGVGC